jgi:hypothetical protein
MALQMQDAFSGNIAELSRFHCKKRIFARPKTAEHIAERASREWIAARSSQFRRLISTGSSTFHPLRWFHETIAIPSQ